MWSVAKNIRREIVETKWKFEGNLNNYNQPPLLTAILKWIIFGPSEINKDNQDNVPKIIKLSSIITQLVVQNMRTSRQTNYQLNNENASTYNKIETPLNVGIGLYVHHQTRSKKLVNFLSDLNIGINYYKVLDIKKDIAIAILDKQEANGGVFVPSSLSNNKPLFFAIDNTDLSIDTPDGKKQLHGTAIAVFQQKHMLR